MPYQVTFSKQLDPPDPEIYINACCFGGDVVLELLLPVIRTTSADFEAGQEDWGWYIWTRNGRIRLAVDIFCDDPSAGAFRMHLTSREHRRFFADRIQDTPELEDLRALVVSRLSRWLGQAPVTTRLDKDYMPVDSMETT